MAVKAVEWAVDGTTGGVVRVRRDDETHVKVTWICGDSRRFSRDDLKEAIANADVFKALDAWLSQKDTGGSPYALRIENDMLYADDFARDDLPNRSVSWSDLKKALKKAVE